MNEELLLNAHAHTLTRRHYGKKTAAKPHGNASLEGSFGPYALNYKTERRKLRRIAHAILFQLSVHAE